MSDALTHAQQAVAAPHPPVTGQMVRLSTGRLARVVEVRGRDAVVTAWSEDIGELVEFPLPFICFERHCLSRQETRNRLRSVR